MWGRLRGVEVVGMTPDVAQGNPDPRVEAYQQTHTISMGWTVAYYTLILAGAYCFYGLVWPWTESANALVTF